MMMHDPLAMALLHSIAFSVTLQHYETLSTSLASQCSFLSLVKVWREEGGCFTSEMSCHRKYLVVGARRPVSCMSCQDGVRERTLYGDDLSLTIMSSQTSEG